MPHIPSAPTAELSILPFADAMARSGQSGGYDAEKWLYVPDFYTEYRYLLGTRGEKPLVCIGINPCLLYTSPSPRDSWARRCV